MSSLADNVHKLEHQLQLCLHDPEQYQGLNIPADLEGLESTLLRYFKIASDKLGMNQDHQDTVEIDCQQLTTLLGRIEDVLSHTPIRSRPLMNIVSESRALLCRHVHTTLESLLPAMNMTIRGAAKELGKNTPEFHVHSEVPFVVTNEGEELLTNIFVHILRNAVDHGIETDAERAQLGKSPTGRIDVQIDLIRNELAFAVSDDGRGINLAAVREKAERQGIVKREARLNDQEVADLIFLPGMSTKDNVSLLSGRGMGMDAVRAYLTEKGGQVRLELKDELPPILGFRYFQLRILVPGTYFRLLNLDQPALAS